MRFRRIVFGLGAEPTEPALAAALDLAQLTEAALLGLFVEERELLELAALPFAREVAMPGAPARSMDPASMQRALRARARTAEERLARRLAGRALEWRFEVVRGSTALAVLEVAGTGDLAVVSLTASARVDGDRTAALRRVREARRPVLLVRERAAPRAPLVAVVGADAASAETVAALGRLARHYGSALAVLALPGAAQDVRAAIGRAGSDARARTLADAGAAALLEAITQERPGLVVLCGDAAIGAAGEALVASAPSPVMLLPAMPA